MPTTLPLAMNREDSRMDDALIERLEYSFNLLAPRGDEMVERFYAELFTRDPGLRSMFPSDLTRQKQKLLEAMVLVIENLRKIEMLADPLRSIGGRQAACGIRLAHYPLICDTLVGVLAEMADEYWDDQCTADWDAALEIVCGFMIEGYRIAKEAAA